MIQTNSRPTISAIARHCGVSKATVSYIANGKSTSVRISPATISRVQQAMEELGWAPDSTAVRLSSQKSLKTRVLLCSPYIVESSSHFSIETFRAVRDEGQELVLETMPYAPGDLAGALARKGGLEARHDALVVSGFSHSEGRYLEGLSPESRKRIILLNRRLPGFAGVAHNEAAAGRLLAEAALSSGSYGLFILYAFEPESSPVRRERARSIAETLRRSGAKAQFVEPMKGQTSREAAEAVLELRGGKPTVIFAPHDAVAAEVLSAARRLGLDIPGEVGITGWDSEPVARWVTPELTTMDTRLYDLAKAAFTMARKLKAGEEPETQVWQASLVRGGTLLLASALKQE